jgi:phosphate/sulfate permease
MRKWVAWNIAWLTRGREAWWTGLPKTDRALIVSMVIAYTLAVGLFVLALLWVIVINVVSMLDTPVAHAIGYSLFIASFVVVAAFVATVVAIVFRTAIRTSQQEMASVGKSPAVAALEKRSVQWRVVIRRLRWLLLLSGVLLATAVGELAVHGYVSVYALALLALPISLLLLTWAWKHPPGGWRGLD